MLVLSHLNSSVDSPPTPPERQFLFMLPSARLPRPHPPPLISAIYLKMAVLGGGLWDDLMDYGDNPVH